MISEVLTRNGLGDNAIAGQGAVMMSPSMRSVLEAVARLLDDAHAALDARDDRPEVICEQAATKLVDARAILAEVLR